MARFYEQSDPHYQESVGEFREHLRCHQVTFINSLQLDYPSFAQRLGWLDENLNKGVIQLPSFLKTFLAAKGYPMVSSIMKMSKSTPSIHAVIDHIIEAGHMNRQQYLQLSSAILSDQKMTDDERRQINRIFDYIQVGRLRLIN